MKTILLFLSILLLCGTTYAQNINIDSHVEQYNTHGFASTTLTMHGINAGDDITWSIVAVDNKLDNVKVNIGNKITGLSWDKPIAGMSIISTHNGQSVTLFDIIGNRDVNIVANIKTRDKTITLPITITFGDGLLAPFDKPTDIEITWLDAYKMCNGVGYKGDPNDWFIGIGIVGGEQMPTMAQLQAIAMPSDKNEAKHAMGAAIAAGWKIGWYWNSRAVMTRRASHINLENGARHGSGGNDVHNTEYAVCIR